MAGFVRLAQHADEAALSIIETTSRRALREMRRLVGLFIDDHASRAGTDRDEAYLPSQLGEAMFSVRPDSTLLSPGTALLVAGIWLVATHTLAAVLITRRDA